MSTEPTLLSIAGQTWAGLTHLWQQARDDLARLRHRSGVGLAALIAGRRGQLAAGHDVNELTKVTAKLTELYEELTLLRDENREDHVQLYLAAFGLIDEEGRFGEEGDAPEPN